MIIPDGPRQHEDNACSDGPSRAALPAARVDLETAPSGSAQPARGAAAPTQPGGDSAAGPSRRAVLRGVAWLGIMASVRPSSRAATLSTTAGDAMAAGAREGWLVTSAGAVPGTRPVSMAMHVHASWSEGLGTMHGQLAEARANGIEVLFWTEHDARMEAIGFRDSVSFSSLTAEPQHGGSWAWQPSIGGAPTATAGGIVTSPASPRDPNGAHSLHVLVSGTDCSFGYVSDASASAYNHRTNITGQTLTIDVFPARVDQSSFLEVLVTIGRRPACAGRPAGVYAISYRVGGPDLPGTLSTQGTLGVVTLGAEPGRWTTLTLPLRHHARLLWPDLDPRDNPIGDIALRAGTTNGSGTAEGYFDWLTFSRSQTGAAALDVQMSLMQKYAPLFPTVRQYQASEISYFYPHQNVFLPSDRAALLLAYPGETKCVDPLPTDQRLALIRGLVDHARALGGLVSFNHPFGARASGTGGNVIPWSTIARQLVTRQAMGVDILEVGYRQRGGASLEDHLALWDLMGRNGLWLSGNGANDNHTGTPGSWAHDANRFITYAWAATADAAHLRAALASGRLFVGDMLGWHGTLDLSVDEGAAVMGQISLRPDLTSRTLTVTASDVPAGGCVEVVRAPVDFAGTAELVAGSTVLASLAASAFASGTANVTVPTPSSSLVRVAVRDGEGTRIAFSNPIWLLTSEPKTAIPAVRRAADTPAPAAV